MNPKEQKDLVTSKVVLVVLSVIAVLVVIWLAWILPARNQNDTDDRAITSFEDCVAAGNPIQESYPEVCMAGGQSFTNPSQNIQALPIKEWGVTFQFTGVSDAYYRYDAAEQTVFVSSQKLDNAAAQVQGCAAGLHGITYERLQPGDVNPDDGSAWTAATLEERGAKHIGEYYYLEKAMVEILCMPDQSNEHVKTANDIKERLMQGFINLTAL